MKCPLCDVTMREVTRRNVLVDVCPECKGIWLERGELDKLLDLAADEEARGYDHRDDDRRRDPRDRDDDDRRGGRGEPVKQQKKSSWLSQVFEAVGGEGSD